MVVALGGTERDKINYLNGFVRGGLLDLREIRRVLKPDGRLVVGELFGDPRFTTRASLERMGAEAGLELVERSGNRLAYFARLAPQQTA